MWWSNNGQYLLVSIIDKSKITNKLFERQNVSMYIFYINSYLVFCSGFIIGYDANKKPNNEIYSLKE